jgi:hypothetical protein
MLIPTRELIGDSRVIVSKHVLLFLVVSVIALCGNADARFLHGGGTANGWQKLLIGAGGTSTGIDIQCDQGVGACSNSGTTTKVVRVDTHGAYVYGSNNCPQSFATCWNQLVTSASMPTSDPVNTAGGCTNSINGTCIPYEVRIAPSNTNIAYMMLNGYMYVTTNLKSAAIAWTNLSGFSRITTGWGGIGGSTTRLWAPYMAIDPQNSNVVYVGTPQSGVFYTTNGGTTWTQISTGTIPAGASNVGGGGQGGGNMFFFDPSDGTGNTVFVTSYGTGVYRCTSAATTPSCAETSTSGMPTTHINGAMSSGGKLYIVANNGGSDQSLYIYTGGGSGTWSTTTAGAAYQCHRDQSGKQQQYRHPKRSRSDGL